MKTISKILSLSLVLAIGGFIGRQITLNGYEHTPVEKEVIKTIEIASKPELKYLNKYVIVPVKDSDTLVRPRDYAYTLNDTIRKEGATIVVNGSGWGSIDSLSYRFEWTEKTKVITQKNKGAYLTAGYKVLPDMQLYEIGVTKINNRLLWEFTAGIDNRQRFAAGAKIGFKIN